MSEELLDYIDTVVKQAIIESVPLKVVVHAITDLYIDLDEEGNE